MVGREEYLAQMIYLSLSVFTLVSTSLSFGRSSLVLAGTLMIGLFGGASFRRRRSGGDGRVGA
jgi:hypothetical protein